MQLENKYHKDWDEYAIRIFDRKDSPEWAVLREARTSHWEEFFSVSRDEKILDAGCGHGEYTVYAIQDGAKVWAFDYSKEMVNFTKTVVEKSNLRAVKISVESITAIPYEDGFFDQVFCLAVLDHVSDEDRKKGMSELNRVLKKGGKLVIDVPNKFAVHWRFIFFIMRLLKLYPKGKIHFFTPFEINKLLKTYNLKKKKSIGLTIMPPFSGIYTTDLRRITFLPGFIIKVLDRIYLFIEKSLRRIAIFKPVCWHYFVEAEKDKNL